MASQSNPEQQQQRETRKLLDELLRLRDEIRLDIHLASMDAKDAWNRLEPRVRDTEQRLARDLGDASRNALRDLTESARELRASMKKKSA